MRYVLILLTLLLAVPAQAHDETEFYKGPNGGHLIDAGDGKQHWELVANGKELTLYVSDEDEKPLDTKGGTATGQILVADKMHTVTFAPSGGNAMKATGDFAAAKGMVVIVKTEKVGGESLQGRLTPLE